MDYESFYEAVQPEEKNFKDKTAALTKASKAMIKALESGDYKTLKKTADTLNNTINDLQAAADAINAEIAGFDLHAYLQGSDFMDQVLAECRKQGIDVVQKETGKYEMFPYIVSTDAVNDNAVIDRKAVPTVRPSVFVDTVRTRQEKLNAMNFKAESFINELAAAYDSFIKKSGKSKDGYLGQNSVYKEMVPMARLRKEYDVQAFAYDIARLYPIRETTYTKDGRRVDFGPSKNIGSAIRILDENGTERYLGEIRFYK
ncbi:MAG: hypothetical protein VZT48_04235 [Bulleidia sp.]|nr:hypothetical protein [Bulleidia sp.]